jgi:pimeloyl-ACP methyl ester carboxylesterase
MTATVVFLHGGGMGGWMWRPQIEALRQFRCLAPDLPAHGANLLLPWTTLRDAARWVADFIAREAPSGRAHVVGLSLGAVIGYELLTAFPESVDRLVLSGGMGLGKPGPTLMSRLMRAAMPLSTNRLLVSMSLAAMRVPAEDRDQARGAMTGMNPDALWGMVEQVLAYQLDEAMLRTRPHAVLAVAGSLEVAAIRRTVRRLEELMPAARAAIVPRGLHTWHWQYPELFSRTVAAWLGGEPLPDQLRLDPA